MPGNETSSSLIPALETIDDDDAGTSPPLPEPSSTLLSQCEADPISVSKEGRKKQPEKISPLGSQTVFEKLVVEEEGAAPASERRSPDLDSSSRNDGNHDEGFLPQSHENASSMRTTDDETNSNNINLIVDYFVPTATLVEQQEPSRLREDTVVNAVLVTNEVSLSAPPTRRKKFAVIGGFTALIAIAIGVGFVFGSANHSKSVIVDIDINQNPMESSSPAPPPNATNPSTPPIESSLPKLPTKSPSDAAHPPGSDLESAFPNSSPAITTPSPFPTVDSTIAKPPSGKLATETAKLLPKDASPNKRFGFGIAIHERTMVVGAIHGYRHSIVSGTAYVFVRDKSNERWVEEAILFPDDGAPYDFFGVSVALHGNTAVVAAHHDGDNGSESGSVYVFVRDEETGNWTERAKLMASDGTPQDEFGWSVGIYEDTVVVGAYHDDINGYWSGSVYVFVRDESDGAFWREQAKLLPADVAERQMFGVSVGICDNTVVVGAKWDDGNGYRSGSAYIFVRDEGSGVWTEEAKLLPRVGSGNNQFGYSVGIDGNTIVVGEGGVDANEYCYVYVFIRDVERGEWMEQDVLRLSSDGARGDYYFGRSVGIHNNTLVVGTATTGVSDAVSVFARDVRTGTWSNFVRVMDLTETDSVGVLEFTVIR